MNKGEGKENKLIKFYRINFKGRPLELSRLVHNNHSLLTTTVEKDLVVKANNLYHGHKYLGNILSIITLTLFASSNLKLNISYKLALSTIPMIIFHYYSHFTYWHIVRDLAINCRLRSKEIVDEAESSRRLNLSKQLHSEIKQEIGVRDCLNTTLTYYISKFR